MNQVNELILLFINPLSFFNNALKMSRMRFLQE